MIEPLDLAGSTDLLFALDGHYTDASLWHLSTMSFLCAILAGFHMSRHYAGRVIAALWAVPGRVHQLGGCQAHSYAVRGIR